MLTINVSLNSILISSMLRTSQLGCSSLVTQPVMVFINSLLHLALPLLPLFLVNAQLGHPSMVLVSHVLRSNYLSYSPSKSLFNYLDCPLAKAQQLSFNSSLSYSTGPLQLLWGDVWSPTPSVSKNGFKYYMSIIDHYIYFFWIFPLKFKFDVLSIFSSFIGYVEQFFNTKIISIQIDVLGKFWSLSPFCTKLGIT